MNKFEEYCDKIKVEPFVIQEEEEEEKPKKEKKRNLKEIFKLDDDEYKRLKKKIK